MVNRSFTIGEERYLQNQLLVGNDRVATKTLQWLCNGLRSGLVPADPNRLRNAALGCLIRESRVAKRWAINALARIGTSSDLGKIFEQTKDCIDDPDIQIAITGAIFAHLQDTEAIALLGKNEIEISGVNLISAAQFSPVQKRVLIDTRIPLEKASGEELRAGIILAGTGEAPEHLFDERHPNAIALSELNRHHISSVRKYSLWGISELDLGFSSVQISRGEIENQPDEVKKWIYRTLVRDAHHFPKNIDLFQQATREKSSDVRLEIAIELKEIYIPDVEKIVQNWIQREPDDDVRFALLEHMATHSEKSSGYKNMVVAVYQSEPSKSDIRARLEAAAAGTATYSELVRISYSDEGLFKMEETKNVTNEINIYGGQVGSVSGSGAAHSDVIQVINGIDSEALREVMSQFLVLIQKLDDKKQAEGQALIKEMSEKPSDSVGKKIVKFLKGVKVSSQSVEGIVQAADGIAGTISGMDLPAL